MSNATAASPISTVSVMDTIRHRHRHGLRAPAGGITIRGRRFRGGQFCLAGPADPAPKGVISNDTPVAKGTHSMGTLPAPAVEPAVVAMTATTGGIDSIEAPTPKGINRVETVAEVGTLALGDYRVNPPIPAIEVGDPAGPRGARSPGTLPTRLAIHGFVYHVECVTIAPSIGSIAYRLDKLDSRSSYHVHKAVDGSLACTCADYEFRQAGSERRCKHLDCLVARGLLTAPAPATLPPFADRGGDGHNLAENEVMGPVSKGEIFSPLDGQVVHRGQAHRVRVAIEGGRVGYLVEMLRPSGEWLAGLAFEDRADAICAARQADDDEDLNPQPQRSAPARPMAAAL